MIPMEDSGSPSVLERIYPEAKVDSGHDAIVVALHACMLEANFAPKADDTIEDQCFPKQLFRSYYKLIYCHSTCHKLACEVTFIPCHNQIPVHGVILNVEQSPTQSIVLPISTYVNEYQGYDDPNQVYKNLPDLCCKFKDDFVFKLLTDMQYVAGVDPTIGLPSMSLDFKFDLLRYLPVKSLVVMSQVNKEFYQLANSSFLWKTLYLRDFPNDLPPNTREKHKWKEYYKNEYCLRRKREKELEIVRHRLDQRPSRLQRIIPYPVGRYFEPRLYDPNRDIDFGLGGMAPELRAAFPHLARRYNDRNIIFRIDNPDFWL